MEAEIEKTKMEIPLWLGIVYVIGILGFLTFLGFLLYSEFKLEKSIIDETYKHNGTCVDNGLIRTCSYQGDTISIINKDSKCYRNDIQINCSEIK